MIQELELDRLKNYEIDYVSGSYKQHIYYATKDGKQPEKRFFVRLILNESDLTDMTHTGASINRLIWGYQSEKLLVETLSALEIVRNDPHFGETDCNHILLNLLPVITGYYIEDLTKIIYDMLRKHGPTMYRLRITEVHFSSSFFHIFILFFFNSDTYSIREKLLLVYDHQVQTRL